jgi:hypothetical protein
MLGDIFLKNLFLKCFWWALRNKEFDFFNFLRGGYKVFSPLSLRKRILIGKKQKVLYTNNSFTYLKR